VKHRWRKGWVTTAILLVAFFICSFPLYYMIIAATLNGPEIFNWPPHLWFGDNLAANWESLQNTIGIGRAMVNSLFVALTHTAIALLLSLMAGYAFAKFDFRGKNLIFGALLATMILPGEVTLVPMFRLMASINWLNTYQVLIVPGLAVPFGIFFIRQAMQSIPNELLDAARVDGAGEFRIFLRVVVPLLGPASAALAIFLFMGEWNSFIWPLVAMRTEDMFTLPVSLSALNASQAYTTDYGQLFLAITIATLPMMLIFLLLQKYFVSGIMTGATKF
jgi:lactose/L-arabinose transport system permease protein